MGVIRSIRTTKHCLLPNPFRDEVLMQVEPASYSYSWQTGPGSVMDSYFKIQNDNFRLKFTTSRRQRCSWAELGGAGRGRLQHSHTTAQSPCGVGNTASSGAVRLDTIGLIYRPAPTFLIRSSTLAHIGRTNA